MVKIAGSIGILLAATLTLAPLPGGGEEKFVELTPEAHTAIAKGIQWLLDNQNRDGTWG